MKSNKNIPERYIERQIINYLRMQKWLACKIRTSGRIIKGNVFSLPKDELGVSDIIACSPDGIFHALEIKNAKGKQSDYQIAWGNMVKRIGGRYTILRSLEDAIEYVKNHTENNPSNLK